MNLRLFIVFYDIVFVYDDARIYSLFCPISIFPADCWTTKNTNDISRTNALSIKKEWRFYATSGTSFFFLFLSFSFLFLVSFLLLCSQRYDKKDCLVRISEYKKKIFYQEFFSIVSQKGSAIVFVYYMQCSFSFFLVVLLSNYHRMCFLFWAENRKILELMKCSIVTHHIEWIR